jgi:hypothetical protein
VPTPVVQPSVTSVTFGGVNAPITGLVKFSVCEIRL